MIHMYSLLAVKARVPPPITLGDFSPPDLTLLKPCYFLPSPAKVSAIRMNLIVLVLTKYIKALQNQNRFVTAHIPHVYSKEMAQPSEIVVADVLHKCETKRSDMIDMMREMMGYLGDSTEKRLRLADQGEATRSQATCDIWQHTCSSPWNVGSMCGWLALSVKLPNSECWTVLLNNRTVHTVRITLCTHQYYTSCQNSTYIHTN